MCYDIMRSLPPPPGQRPSPHPTLPRDPRAALRQPLAETRVEHWEGAARAGAGSTRGPRELGDPGSSGASGPEHEGFRRLSQLHLKRPSFPLLRRMGTASSGPQVSGPPPPPQPQHGRERGPAANDPSILPLGHPPTHTHKHQPEERPLL
ncbi:hypothetical protein HPG69_000393 [Diceros bicornis minor]|uniref:Uncharacterized protein n=1 Tax=Diceros bicornis minor TaxID=77932 RepID=A0A7J7FCV2_DICBM|nr:hypothetical protein HPG69_000393 [Diceros bicornis minor]